MIYPLVKDQAMVHDAHRRFESEVFLWADFGYPLVHGQHVGEVWTYCPPADRVLPFYPDGALGREYEPLFRRMIEKL